MLLNYKKKSVCTVYGFEEEDSLKNVHTVLCYTKMIYSYHLQQYLPACFRSSKVSKAVLTTFSKPVRYLQQFLPTPFTVSTISTAVLKSPF